ncbi:unnamed protein product [Rangifer tarandus platyrhynchus]|uniref:Uncharacterized protein n=1 Tax=Rangifer tarandus platyrhynchus TaxID=3082113 RepID=A0AC59ZW56_RANTA
MGCSLSPSLRMRLSRCLRKVQLEGFTLDAPCGQGSDDGHPHEDMALLPTAALLTVARRWTQPKRPLAGAQSKNTAEALTEPSDHADGDAGQETTCCPTAPIRNGQKR